MYNSSWHTRGEPCGSCYDRMEISKSNEDCIVHLGGGSIFKSRFTLQYRIESIVVSSIEL